MSKEPAGFKVGDTVKWTGKANGGEVKHQGIITKIWAEDKTANVECPRKNKQTGADLKPAKFGPRLSALTLVKAKKQMSGKTTDRSANANIEKGIDQFRQARMKEVRDGYEDRADKIKALIASAEELLPAVDPK